MYTGFLQYKNKDYTFILDEKVNKLRLIPTVDNMSKCYVNLWGLAFMGEQPKMEEPYLIGTINENHQIVVLITMKNSCIRRANDILYIELYAFILLKTDSAKLIDKLSFCSPEINRIFDVKRALNFDLDSSEKIEDYCKNGVARLSTNDFDNTTSKLQTFNIDGKAVNVSFQIERTINLKFDEPPLYLASCLCFEFEATDDYSFIIKLCCCAKNFIRFLCSRRNTYLSSIKVYAPYEKDQHEEIGTIVIFDNKGEPEQKPLKENICIKYEYIAGSEDKILSDIVANKLYLNHLPKTYEDGKHIDAASFVMITSAFEWEFSRNYPNGIAKSEDTLEAENSVSEEIRSLLVGSSGKKKELYRFLLRLVKSDSLQSKIIQIGKDYSEIIGVFGNNLYFMNNQESKFKYSEIGRRVSNQRNNFAHGNLDKEFINESLLDVIFLKYAVYALQLKYYGLTDENIRKSINDVFGLNYAL